VVCKEVLMAPITWGPRTCAPLPVVPTAAGGFEDLRKVKEKLALTLQNNGMGWGEGTPQRSKCVWGAYPCTVAPQKPVPRGKQRISINMAWGKKSVLFSDLPPQAPAKKVHSSIYYISKIMPRSGGAGWPGLGAGKDVVGGQAGRKPLIQCLVPRLHIGQREGSAPSADARSVPRIKSPSVHSLGAQPFFNIAALPSWMV